MNSGAGPSAQPERTHVRTVSLVVTLTLTDAVADGDTEPLVVIEGLKVAEAVTVPLTDALWEGLEEGLALNEDETVPLRVDVVVGDVLELTETEGDNENDNVVEACAERAGSAKRAGVMM